MESLLDALAAAEPALRSHAHLAGVENLLQTYDKILTQTNNSSDTVNSAASATRTTTCAATNSAAPATRIATRAATNPTAPATRIANRAADISAWDVDNFSAAGGRGGGPAERGRRREDDGGPRGDKDKNQKAVAASWRKAMNLNQQATADEERKQVIQEAKNTKKARRAAMTQPMGKGSGTGSRAVGDVTARSTRSTRSTRSKSATLLTLGVSSPTPAPSLEVSAFIDLLASATIASDVCTHLEKMAIGIISSPSLLGSSSTSLLDSIAAVSERCFLAEQNKSVMEWHKITSNLELAVLVSR
jgi:hypothetical protein